MKTAFNTDRQSLFPQNVYDLDMYMFKIYTCVSLVETCPVMPGAELPFGREHLRGKSVSDLELHTILPAKNLNFIMLLISDSLTNCSCSLCIPSGSSKIYNSERVKNLIRNL